MKYWSLILALLAQPLLADEADPYSGIYYGSINAVSATLKLTRNKQQIEGSLDADNYIYTLSATEANERIAGQLKDPQTGAIANMQLWQTEKGKLQLLIQMPGQPQALNLAFSRDKPRNSSSQNTAKTQRNPALVGRWRYNQSYTSGSFSGAYQESLLLYPDGRFEIGEGKFAGGTAGVSGSSSGGQSESGEWKTDMNQLYVRANNGGPWQLYCRYSVSSDSMLFIFANGEKKLWSRQY